MKTCSKCREQKDPAKFSADNRRSDKKSLWCKECMKLYKKIKNYKVSEDLWKTLRIRQCQERITHWQNELDKAKLDQDGPTPR